MQEGKILLRARGTDLKSGQNTANAIILVVILIGRPGKGPRPPKCDRTPGPSPGALLNDLHGHLLTTTGRAGIAVIEQSSYVTFCLKIAVLSDQNFSPNCDCKWRTAGRRHIQYFHIESLEQYSL